MSNKKKKKTKAKTKRKSAPRRGNNTLALSITTSVIMVILLIGIALFVGFYFPAVQAIFRGESIYTQKELNDTADKNYSDGFSEGFEEGFSTDWVRKGDLIQGFYFNTDVIPTFDELDWSKTLNYEMILPDNSFVNISIYWLVTGFEPPKSIDEMGNIDNNALCLSVTRYTKSDGSEAYVLGLDPSTPIYAYLPNGEFYLHKDFVILESGWAYDEDWDGYKALSYAPEGIRAVYVDNNQPNWYKYISKNSFKEPEYGATEHKDGDIITNLYVNTALSDAELYEICQNGLITKFTGDENLVIELVADVMRPEGEEPVAAICFSFNNDPPVVVWCSRDYSADGRTAVSGWNEVGVDGLIFSAPPVSLGVDAEYEYLFNQLFSSTPFCAYKN